MSNLKTNRKIICAGCFCLLLLLSLLVSACRSVQTEENGEPQNAPEQTSHAGGTDSEFNKQKRRTVLIDADSFSPGAYLPFNASCFDCFLFPTYDVNGFYLDFAPASLIEDLQGDPMYEITQVNGIHCFLVSPRLHRTNGVFLGAVARPKTFVSGVSLIGAGTNDFPFSVNLIRQDGVSFSLFGAPLECNGVSFSLFGAPLECNGVSFSLLGICRRQRQGVYCSLFNCSSAPDRTEDSDPQSVVQFGVVNSCQNGVQIGLLNFNENGFLPVFPLFNFSTKNETTDSDSSVTRQEVLP